MSQRCSISAFPAHSRRRFLVAGSAAIALAGFGVVGCSREDEALPPQLQSLFFPSFVLSTGIDQRIPFGLIDQGIPLNDDTTSFRAVIRRGDEVLLDADVPARIVAHDHPEGNEASPHEHADLLRYFAVRAKFDDPGIYDLELSFDGKAASLPFQIFDRDDVIVPLPGEKLPLLRFPTFTDQMDMDPICTQFGGPCPLHDKTIEEALETGKPLALLIATPAFCETAYCGPVLDVMLELQPDFPDIEFLHAEVYQNPNEADGNFLDESVTRSPTVLDLGLPFEPTLFLLQPDRTITDRIDNVYDNSELREALERL
ncbi:MAG: twin-arginine translocation signal domain-containing protein [Acidimicrobiales bacterium]